MSGADLAREELYLTDDPDDLRAADFFIVTVPTPIDDAHRPDLRALLSASRIIGNRLKRGDIIVDGVSRSYGRGMRPRVGGEFGPQVWVRF